MHQEKEVMELWYELAKTQFFLDFLAKDKKHVISNKNIEEAKTHAFNVVKNRFPASTIRRLD